MADSTQPGDGLPEDATDSLRKQRKREYDRQRYLQNKDRVAAQQRAYLAANGDRIRERARRRYWSDPERYRRRNQQSAKKNRAKNSARERAWRKQNKEKVRAYNLKYVTKKRQSDVSFRLQMIVRARIHAVLTRTGGRKRDPTLRFVGCTGNQLKSWIENQFSDGMTWDNYGHSGWHIDHIIPLAKFDLTDPVQQVAAFHYTNLRPLWAFDNLRKSDKVSGQSLFGFAYAARIADAASAKPKKHRKRGE